MNSHILSLLNKQIHRALYIDSSEAGLTYLLYYIDDAFGSFTSITYIITF